MAGPYYSDHFTATTSGTSIDDPRIIKASGVNHAALRYKRGSVTFPDSITTGEIGHFFKVKSGDRPIMAFASTTSFTGTGQPASLGLYDGDGVVIDADCLNAEDDPFDNLTVAITRADQDVLAGATAVMDEEDRGQPFWYIANEGAGTYTEDPLEEWYVSITMGTENSVSAGAEVVLELFYTADGN